MPNRESKAQIKPGQAQRCYLQSAAATLAVLGLSLALGSCSRTEAPTVAPAEKSSPAASASPSAAPPASSPSPAADANKSENTKAIEKAVTGALTPQVPSPITAVNCPNVEQVEAGKTIDCQVTVAEGTFPATVKFTDSSGKFSVSSKNFLNLTSVEQQLVESVKSKNNLDVKADCGGKVKLFKSVGETLQCKLVQPNGKEGTATVTVQSLEGNVDANWQIAK